MPQIDGAVEHSSGVTRLRMRQPRGPIGARIKIRSCRYAHEMDTHLSTLVEIAADLRRRAGQEEPAYSTHKIIETAFPDAVVTGRRLPPGVLEAVSRTSEGPVIIYARGLSAPAQRFAIAHALGHLILDGDEAFRQPGQPRCEMVERRADAFATELLVPLVELEPYVCRWPSSDEHEHEIYLDMVDEISSHFGVRCEVVDGRIRELSCLVKKSA